MDQWKEILGGAIARSADATIESAELIRQNIDDAKSVLILDGLNAPEAAGAFVATIYPDGVPTNEDFFHRLARLRTSLGFGQPEAEIIATLASAAVGVLAEEDRSLILLGIADEGHNDLGLRVEILPQIVRDHAFPVPLLAKVLTAVADKQLQGHNGYDRAVRNLAEFRTELSFALVEALIREWGSSPPKITLLEG